MRRNLPFLLIFVFLLAACGGNPTAAPTADNSSVQQPAATVDNSTTPVPQITTAPRDYGTDLPAVSPPGTLIAAVTPDPAAGTVFESLIFNRTGGLAGTPLSIQINGAGVMIRDGVTSQLTADQITQLVATLDSVNFFGLSGIFTSPGTSADAYHYELTVSRDGSERTLKAEDGFIPAPLVRLFGEISALGQPG